MTTIEFNEKYRDYLKDGHYGMSIPNEKVISALDKVFEQTLTKIPGFKFTQIKIKFKQARFYSNLGMETNLMVESFIEEILNITEE